MVCNLKNLLLNSLFLILNWPKKDSLSKMYKNLVFSKF